MTSSTDVRRPRPSPYPRPSPHPLPRVVDRPRRSAILTATRWLTLHRTTLAVALAGGAVLRLVDLGRVGLNSDEAVYASQGASLAGNPHFSGLFPVVRAHPLMLQMLLSVLYRAGRQDTIGRYVVAAFGVGTIALVYVAGRQMYGPLVGALAALFLAVMPYHLTITRQILLDGPMTFFTTAALACLAAAANRGSRRWLVAAGACLGTAALCKETGFLLAMSSFVFLCVTARLWRPTRYVVAGAAMALGLGLTYPALTAAAGGGRGGQSYLLWQLTRPPNHGYGFYLTAVAPVVGVGLLVLAGCGLLLRRSWSWRETLLLSWLVVPLAYYEVWPLKGFAYLVPLTPAVALLAACGVSRIAQVVRLRRSDLAGWIAAAAAAACLVTLIAPAAQATSASPAAGLAGAGGTPGGRETGQWVATHLPASARLMTIGPSMANLIRYYSGRKADGLSVSPNPLHRNPSNQAIINPDLMLRSGTYQYIVWDTYSASRSSRFGDEATSLAKRFAAQVVHRELGPEGKPLVLVYAVHVPGARFSAENPAPAAPVSQPDSAALYAGYGTALGVALALLAWAADLRRRRFSPWRRRDT